MDMYQKRKIRKENKKNNTQENSKKSSFNWYIPPYGKTVYNSHV